MKDMIKMGIFLMVVGGLAAGILAAVNSATLSRIEAEKQKEINLALKEIMPQADSFEKTGETVYLAKLQGAEIGKVVRASAPGYSGEIEVLTGVGADGKITGVKIVKISETPGLGMNAVSPKFLDQFKNKSAGDKLEPKDDIQSITGATITSRAVSNAVKTALSRGGQPQ